MDLNKEREAFNNYFKEKYPELYGDVFKEDGDERAIIGYSFALSAWKAAKSQVLDGFVSIDVRVPKEGQDVIAFDAIKNCVFKDGEFQQTYFESDTEHEYTEPVEVTYWKAIESQEPAHD